MPKLHKGSWCRSGQARNKLSSKETSESCYYKHNMGMTNYILDKDDTVEACRLWNVAKQVGVNVVREKKEGFEPYGQVGEMRSSQEMSLFLGLIVG